MVFSLPLLWGDLNNQTATAVTGSAVKFWEIRIGDVIMIAAVILAPISALWIQWQLQLRQGRLEAKRRIFRTLMATRSTSLDVNHVQSLNMIDVEFSSGSTEDREIRTAWQNYLDYLNTPQPQDQIGAHQWGMTRLDVLATLLSKMGKPLGYDFPFTDYKNKTYQPTGLADNWNDSVEIRRGVLAMLNGKPLKMDVTSLPAQPTVSQPAAAIPPPNARNR
jgi:hypothetical protein